MMTKKNLNAILGLVAGEVQCNYDKCSLMSTE